MKNLTVIGIIVGVFTLGWLAVGWAADSTGSAGVRPDCPMMAGTTGESAPTMTQGQGHGRMQGQMQGMAHGSMKGTKQEGKPGMMAGGKPKCGMMYGGKPGMMAGGKRKCGMMHGGKPGMMAGGKCKCGMMHGGHGAKVGRMGSGHPGKGLGPRGMRGLMKPFHVWLGRLMVHRDVIGLNPEQLDQIDEATTAHLSAAVRRKAEVRALHIQLKRLLRQVPVDLAAADTLLKESADLKFQLQREGVRLYARVLEILTDPQKAKAADVIGSPFPTPWESMQMSVSPDTEADSDASSPSAEAAPVEDPKGFDPHAGHATAS